MKKVKLQVPMDKDVREGLEKRARELGFDSAQAFIRVWAKTQINRGITSPVDDDWGEPSDKAAARINKAAEEAKKGINVSGPFNTVEEMMAHLDSL